MPLGLPICALRASEHHTSEAGSGGWPSPAWHDGRRPAPDLHSTQGTNLSRDAVLWTAGWPTPSAKQFEQDPEAWEARRQRNLTKGYNGNGQGATLDIVAKASGWPTPDTTNVNDGTPYEVQKRQLLDRRERVRQQQQEGTMTPGSGRSMALQMAAQAAGWMTSGTSDDHTKANQNSVGKQAEELIAGWGMPTSVNHPGSSDRKPNKGHESWTNGLLVRQALGTGMTSNGSTASTTSGGLLNPELPRWLMGYPRGWSENSA